MKDLGTAEAVEGAGPISFVDEDGTFWPPALPLGSVTVYGGRAVVWLDWYEGVVALLEASLRRERALTRGVRA